MGTEKGKMFEELLRSLMKQRDELSLQIHLGKADLKDEWDEMQKRLDRLNDDFKPMQNAMSETADDVWESMKLVGDELMRGFHRIRKSL